MKTLKLIGLTTVIASAFSLATTSVMADDDMQTLQNKVSEFGLISVDEAKSIATRTKQGVVEDIELDGIDNGGGWEYEVEVVQEDGSEWDIDIHAKTGEVRKVERD